MNFAILIAPSARVYNLRLLLLGSITTIVYCGIVLSTNFYLYLAITLSCCSVITLHHILVLFPRHIRILAALDFALLTVETGFICYLVHWSLDFGRPPVTAFLVAQLAALVLSIVFRLATIIKSQDGFLCQCFAFLGGCPPAFPAYTSLAILLNRSVARPLVRGESTGIILVRAVILSCASLAVPAFAIYFIFVLPARELAYTRSMVIDANGSRGRPGYPGGNPVVSLQTFDYSDSYVSLSKIQVQADGKTNCPVDHPSPYVANYLAVARCPQAWLRTDTISISLSISGKTGGVWVSVYDNSYTSGVPDINWTPVPLLSGSSLFGVLSWTERRRIGLRSWRIAPVYAPLFIADVIGLQPYPFHVGAANITTLTLKSGEVRKLLQDTVDASAISGIATVGGFWSFLNGAFVLVFGANVIYFALGKSPVQYLQCPSHPDRRTKTIIRAWGHTYLPASRFWSANGTTIFPALHSEGGRPGSESAGIVAFIRERLVDVGLDPRVSENTENDLESQRDPDIPDSLEDTQLKVEPVEEEFEAPQRDVYGKPEHHVSFRLE
ncbi:Short-chain dehydrogenase/reductase family protein [Mycena venus]|uniref:Short-chain dehydrogenase/reductase family protein n=1 Tax=Mycena venus TaxID=2733690 RepID=A0A8H6WTT2_9AGAR|nr:Short-chain dehydrogenase/reductase family protein [Mycena venus]